MKKNMLWKGLVVGVIFLFIGIAIQPGISTPTPKKEEINVEPKDYLFETILEIANNSKVKDLFEEYNQKLIRSDFNYRSMFIKLLFKNPRLLFSMLLTKPSYTYTFLDLSYKRGIELTNIFGEDAISEMTQSLEVTDSGLLDELTSIINDDKILSDRIEAMRIMNNDLKSSPPLEDYPNICAILKLIALPVFFLLVFSAGLTQVNSSLLAAIGLLSVLVTGALSLLLLGLFDEYGC